MKNGAFLTRATQKRGQEELTAEQFEGYEPATNRKKAANLVLGRSSVVVVEGVKDL